VILRFENSPFGRRVSALSSKPVEAGHALTGSEPTQSEALVSLSRSLTLEIPS
jgi:hypothetical protein